jgi:hypothetical protein
METDYILANKKTLNQINKKTHGIYFLIKGNSIVYVGQTSNGLKRVQEHVNQKEKDFDHYCFIECEGNKKNDLEAIFISIYHPLYNKIMPKTELFTKLTRLDQCESMVKDLNHFGMHSVYNDYTGASYFAVNIKKYIKKIREFSSEINNEYNKDMERWERISSELLKGKYEPWYEAFYANKENDGDDNHVINNLVNKILLTNI